MKGETIEEGGAVAWWLRSRTPDPEIGGSSPTQVRPCCVLEQDIYTLQKHYTPNVYLVPAEFGVRSLPCLKDIPKRTKMHLNEVGLTNTEICNCPIQLRQPPISWKISSFFFQLFVTRE